MSDRLYYIPWALVSSGILTRIKPSTCKVFMALMAHDGPDGIWPTRPTLAKECDLDIRILDAAIAELEAEKLVQVVRGSNRRNRYIPLAIGAFNVATENVATKTVATENAPTIGALNVPIVGALNAPMGVHKMHPEHTAQNTKQGTPSTEHQAGAAPLGADAPVRADGPVTSTAAKALSAGGPVSIPPAPTPLQAGEAQSVTSTASEFPDDDPLLKLAAWFGYGKPGEAAPQNQWKTLKPTKTNWFHQGIIAGDSAALSKVDPAAEPIQVAAYAWYRLQALRIDHGLPVVRPGSDDLRARRGRSGGVLGGLLNERGLSGTLAIIVAACEHADAIIDAAQGLTSPPAFDVGFFRHKHTVRAAERFAASAGQPDYFSADDPLTQIGAYL